MSMASRPVGQRKLRVGSIPDHPGWNHVKNGQPLDSLGMVQSQAVSDTTAAVVPGHREAREAEFFHDDDHVVRHGSLRIGRMVSVRGGTPATAIAAKVGTDNRKPTGQLRGDIPPHQVRLREPMQ
jgi:hypothetical protein